MIYLSLPFFLTLVSFLARFLFSISFVPLFFFLWFVWFSVAYFRDFSMVFLGPTSSFLLLIIYLAFFLFRTWESFSLSSKSIQIMSSLPNSLRFLSLFFVFFSYIYLLWFCVNFFVKDAIASSLSSKHNHQSALYVFFFPSS